MEKLTKQDNDRSKKVSILCHFENTHGEVTDALKDPKNLGSSASTRLQIIPSLTALNTMGFQETAHSLLHLDQTYLSKLNGSRACLIGKLSANTIDKIKSLSAANLNVIHNLKRQNSKIILTYCDNHLFRSKIPELSEFYKELFKLADFVIYPTETLKLLSEAYTPKSAETFVIKDPWQVRTESPYQKRIKGEPWRIIWFGSNKSVQYLCQILPGLLQSKKLQDQYELTILGSEFSLTHVQSFIPRNKSIFNHWTLRLATWNAGNQPEQLETELKRAHMSMIPTDHIDPLNQGTSHNRLVDSIRGGCLPIASPLMSYQELAKVSILGNDFENLLLQATEQYERLIKKHQFYRTDYLKQFSPQTNLNSWVKLWNSVLNS